MNEASWSRDTIKITYSDPHVTPHREVLINSTEDFMYFYYDITIHDEDKLIFKASTHDFPKVKELPEYIDYIINLKNEDMFPYEDFEHYGFHRKKYYYFIELDDDFGMDMEYFYKIERMDTYVKKRDESEYKKYEEYILTIGNCSNNKNGYSNGEPFGHGVFIKAISKEQLLELKSTAISFCNIAIEVHNNNLKSYRIKCPNCNEVQLYLDCLDDTEDEFDEYTFTCELCEHKFNDNDDYYID